jgi:hypothetical protein
MTSTTRSDIPLRLAGEDFSSQILVRYLDQTFYSDLGRRWVFYIATIVSGISAVAAIFMKESRATSLLDKKVEKIRKETGQEKLKT